MAPPLSPQHTSAAHGRALHRRAGRAPRCTAPAYAGRARAVRERGHAPLCSRLQMSGGGVLHTRRGTPPRRRHPAADAAGHGCGPAKRARRMRPAAPRRAASAARAARARHRSALWRCCAVLRRARRAALRRGRAAAAIAPRCCRAWTAAPSPGGTCAALRCAAPAYASLRAHGTRAARRESAAAVATREATGGGGGRERRARRRNVQRCWRAPPHRRYVFCRRCSAWFRTCRRRRLQLTRRARAPMPCPAARGRSSNAPVSGLGGGAQPQCAWARAAGRVAAATAHAAARMMTVAATTWCRQRRWRRWRQPWWARWVCVAIAGRRAHARAQQRTLAHRALRAVAALQHSECGRTVEREQQHGSSSPARATCEHTHTVST